MEKEKAEIASLVEKYGRVQSLMKYVNKDTFKESYSKQPKGKAVGADGVMKLRAFSGAREFSSHHIR